MYKTYLSFPRNIYLLFLTQTIGGVAASASLLLAALIGADISPSPTLVTFPATSFFIGMALGTIPAALLMRKIGRRKGFLFSSLLAFCAALVAAYSVYHHLFYLFSLSMFLTGLYSSFVQQYRFSASESVSKSSAAKAVGFVLFAGILSGIIGPEIAKLTKDTFSLPGFTGSFLILAVLFLFSAFLLLFLKDTHVLEEKAHTAERTLKSILTQPRFYIAVLAAATAYSIMTFIMGAIPVHLHILPEYTLDNIVLMNQSHMIGMYFPSLFAGFIIHRLGVYRTLTSGLGMYCLAIVFGVHAHTFISYWIVAVLIGIGWNFLYISATLLLSQTHSHTERFKAQGVNDFFVFLSQVIASFLAGGILLTNGWISLNLLALPLIFVAFLVFTAHRKALRREQ